MGIITGSFDSLFKYPKRKTVNYTNYAERDGITSDLRKFETEPRRISLNFLMKHNSEAEFRTRYNDFFQAVNDVDYRKFDLETGLIHTLRYDKTQKFVPIRLFNHGPAGTSFTMDFIEDNSAIDPTITVPSGNMPLKGSYIIDGRDFGEFGVHPEGEIGDVLKYPDVKEPFFDGRTYNLDVRMLKHKEITLKFWMHADSKEEFVHNYQAFFNAFAKKGLQQLYIKEIAGTTEVYYMDCTSCKMHWGEKPGAFFSLKLCIPVVTWESGSSSIYTVLEDTVLGLLADENENVITI